MKIKIILLLFFFTNSVWSATGIDISLSNDDINFGVFSSTLFEDSEAEDERYGDIYAHVNLLIANQGDASAIDGIIEVSRQVLLENSQLTFGVGLRPIYARFQVDSRDQDALAIQLGGQGGYDFEISSDVDMYVQGSAYYAPEILTFSNRFSDVLYFNVQAGIYVISNTAFYLEYESEEISADEGDNVELVNGALVGLRIGF